MDLKFYLSIFLRRLPYFLVVATVISAAAITAAITLPPAYESTAKVIVESPQIPEELAQSTVQSSPLEQLQILRNKLLTRDNLLDIARRLEVLPNLDEMSADEIVNAMRARASVSAPRNLRNSLPLMTLRFEAPNPRKAAAVLNEFLTLIQEEDAEFRRGRSGETVAFFTLEVERLGQELSEEAARILEYKQANTDALPDSLDFRMTQMTTLQQRVSQIGRDITSLRDQKERLILLFEQTGDLDTPDPRRPDPIDPNEERLAVLKTELQEALVIFAPTNPRIILLESRIAQLEETIELAAADLDTTVLTDAAPETPPTPTRRTAAEIMLDIELREIDSQITSLTDQQAEAETQIETLSETIQRTPEISITLEDLDRRYQSIEAQYNAANNRLNAARTGDVIETRSRGQRISVLEQPAVPTEPTKPNRIVIAGGGVMLGIGAGIALIVLLEILNTTVRRPQDLVAKLGVTPFTTIPYIRTRGERFRQLTIKLIIIGVILTGVPAAVWAVHTYYLPLDLLADKVMDKIGIRW